MKHLASPQGENFVLLTQDEYEDLVDGRDAAIAMRDIEGGRLQLIPMNDVDEAVAAPLTYWRKRSGLTQAALAKIVGLSQAYVAQIENGARQGDVRTMAALAQALQVRIEDLLSP